MLTSYISTGAGDNPISGNGGLDWNVGKKEAAGAHQLLRTPIFTFKQGL